MADILNQSIGGFSLGHILTAVITFLICILVVRVLLRVLERILSKTKLDGRVRGYILSGAKVVLYIIAVVIAAQGLGVNMTSLVALLSVASLGITLAAEDNGLFTLNLRDSAVRFNPFEMARTADGDPDPDFNAVGMQVIKTKAISFYYRRYQGFNTMVVKI